MSLTSLNLGALSSSGTAVAVKTEDCPSCGAPKAKRVDGGSFGRFRLTLCGDCGHEFKEQNT